jgi:tetratricopeptide (TPR) repeat protein
MSYSLGNGADMTFTVEETSEEHYRQGVAALRATPPRNAEALRAFNAAYTANPNPRGLIGIGIALQRLKRFSEAKARFQRYLREEPSGSLAERARRGVAETQAALDATSATGPKAPASDMNPAAYAAARSRSATQIAAGTGLPPLTLREPALSMPLKLTLGAVGLFGIGAVVWAITRR